DVGAIAGCVRPSGLSVTIGAAEWMRALVVMLVPAHDHVDTVAVEERQELLADAPIAAIRVVGRGDRGLVHADDDPVDVALGSRRRERGAQPCALRSAAVAAYIGIAAVLVADVVVGNRYHTNRSRLEGVPEPAALGSRPAVRKCEACLVGAISD